MLFLWFNRGSFIGIVLCEKSVRIKRKCLDERIPRSRHFVYFSSFVNVLPDQPKAIVKIGPSRQKKVKGK